MDPITLLVLGGLAIGGYLVVKKGAATNGTTTPGQGVNAGYTALQGQPQTVAGSSNGGGSLDGLFAAGGGIAGAAVGTYFGGPLGGAVGAKVGTAVGPTVGNVTKNQLTNQAQTTVAATKGVLSGTADILHGDVVGGSTKVVTNSVKAAAAPITSTISAIKGLF